MIRIERIEISTHFRNPGAAFGPVQTDGLCFIHQLVTHDGWIIAVKLACYGVATRGYFFHVLAIEAPGCLVCVKEHRALVVNSKGSTIIRGIVNAGPPQVLRYAAGISPPVG